MQKMKLFAACGLAVVLSACGAVQPGDVVDELDPSMSEEVGPAADESEVQSVEQGLCSHYSTRWVYLGCTFRSPCLNTAKWRKQICIYNAWYWQNVYACDTSVWCA